MLALMLVVLFVVVPTAMGYAIPGAMTARTAWLALGAVLAVSQARGGGDLGGLWVLVVLVVALGLLLVEAGRRLRAGQGRDSTA